MHLDTELHIISAKLLVLQDYVCVLTQRVPQSSEIAGSKYAFLQGRLYPHKPLEVSELNSVTSGIPASRTAQREVGPRPMINYERKRRKQLYRCVQRDISNHYRMYLSPRLQNPRKRLALSLYMSRCVSVSLSLCLYLRVTRLQK